MAGNKVTIDPPKDGNLNINVSVTTKADKSNAAAPAIQSVENLNVKSIQNLNAAEKKSAKKSDKAPAKSDSSAQLMVIAKTLDEIKNALVTITAAQTKKSSGKKSGGAEDSVEGKAQALIQSYADKSFERGIKEAFDKVEFSKDFHDKFADSIKSALADATYVVNNEEKADGEKKEEVKSTATGEETTKTEYTSNSALTEEHAASLLQIRDELVNNTSLTQEKIDSLVTQMGSIASDATLNQLLNLNTQTSDATLNALNSDVKAQATEKTAENKEVESEKAKIDADIHIDVAQTEKAEEGKISSVSIQEIKDDLKLGDSDLTKMVEETQGFFTSYKETSDALDQTNQTILQQMDDMLGNIEGQSTDMKSNGEELSKSLNRTC